MIALLLAGALSVMDGDTFRLASGEVVRLEGIDAPEICKAKCDAELVRGVEARLRLRELLESGPLVLDRHGKDRYGRTLAHVRAGGRDVGEAMIESGLAVAWAGRRHVWCGSAD